MPEVEFCLGMEILSCLCLCGCRIMGGVGIANECQMLIVAASVSSRSNETRQDSVLLFYVLSCNIFNGEHFPHLLPPFWFVAVVALILFRAFQGTFLILDLTGFPACVALVFGNCLQRENVFQSQKKKKRVNLLQGLECKRGIISHGDIEKAVSFRALGK